MTAIDALNLARSHGLNPAALHPLLVLIEDSPLQKSEIAKRTGTTPAAATGMVDRLERGGWVISIPNGKDRRTRFVIPSTRAFDLFSDTVE